MSALTVAGAVVSLALLVYLFFALLRPEMFQ
jgi:K+-transporting ATPase KdpF subunit